MRRRSERSGGYLAGAVDSYRPRASLARNFKEDAQGVMSQARNETLSSVGTSCCLVPSSHRANRSRHRITALRLELWLRALCHSNLRHRGLDSYPTFQIPDVFTTARTLARAISRYADFLVTSSPHGEGQPVNGNPRFHSDGPSMGARGNLSNLANGAKDSLHYAGIPQDGASGSSEQPRRALFARLRGAPPADALDSWVSSIVQTVRQFREWLPWQAFADELRGLLQLSVREPPARGMDWEGRATQAEPVAAVAGAYAMCEVLLAWEGVKVGHSTQVYCIRRITRLMLRYFSRGTAAVEAHDHPSSKLTINTWGACDAAVVNASLRTTASACLNAGPPALHITIYCVHRD